MIMQIVILGFPSINFVVAIASESVLGIQHGSQETNASTLQKNQINMEKKPPENIERIFFENIFFGELA